MNVNKPCTSCKKTVYPMEQLKCLEQYWHKSCFKCEVCKTVLNMKNYKGFDKKPYCHAHYPTMKHTPVSDTPELKRVMANSQKVSQIKYHEQFERTKGQKISVTDDPLSSLQKKTQQNISQVAYHNLKDKRQTMEARRSSLDTTTDRHQVQPRQPGPVHEYEPNGAGASVDMRRMSTGSSSSSHSVGDRASFYTRAAAAPIGEAGTVQVTHQTQRFKPGRIEDYDPMNEEYGSVTRMSASSDVSRGPRPSSFQGDVSEETMPAPMPQRSPVHQAAPRGPYSPPVPVIEANPNEECHSEEEPVFQSTPDPTVKESGTIQDGGDLTPVAEATEFIEPAQPSMDEPSVAVQEPTTPPTVETVPPAPQEVPRTIPDEQYTGDIQQPENGRIKKKADRSNDVLTIVCHRSSIPVPWPEGVEYGKAPLYRAAYEYDSQDTDEVSFVEGDIISNGLPIDEGWMYGLVERTGAYGMMPSNYVTPL